MKRNQLVIIKWVFYILYCICLIPVVVVMPLILLTIFLKKMYKFVDDEIYMMDNDFNAIKKEVAKHDQMGN